MFEKIKHFFKYTANPMDPEVDPQSAESRRNWILYMAHRDKRFPVSSVAEKLDKKFVGDIGVSGVTINKDFLKLEAEGLMKREKDNSTGKSYIVPLFEDDGEAPVNSKALLRRRLLKWGLPLMSIPLMIILSLIVIFV